jgi:hypothetical protein
MTRFTAAMTRLTHAWRALQAEQRLAAVAALALLVTMFFPWYGLQSLNPKSHQIYSHSINAFGDVSFVEAAIFLVAAGVLAMLFARAEGREFHLPGGDGTVVMVAGGWAALLIFFRVFSRPAGNGYPVGIEWGFFLAFVAAGALGYAGWRMRAAERPEPPAARSRRGPPQRDRSTEVSPRRPPPESGVTAVVPAPARPGRSAPVPADRGPAGRPRHPPPPPGEQMSFEDRPAEGE